MNLLVCIHFFVQFKNRNGSDKITFFFLESYALQLNVEDYKAFAYGYVINESENKKKFELSGKVVAAGYNCK